MKTITANLKTHLASEVTTLATCWRVERQDGTISGFTDHTKNLIIDDADLGLPTNNVTYEASTGYTPSAVQDTSSLAVDNLDLMGLLDSTGITEADLAAGLYDFAEIHIFIVNYLDLTQEVMKIKRGRLGEVTRRRSQFVAEMRSLSQFLQQTTGKVISVTCRADLGDSDCKVTLSTFTVTGTITLVTDRTTFADSTRTEADDHFNFGLLTWTSGNNNGLEMEVKDYVSATDTFILFQPMPYDVQIGDGYSVYAGCDKLTSTCKTKFNNFVNFRGEPFVPGPDQIMRGPA